MTVIINNSNAKNISTILKEKLKKSHKTGNLSNHFGKLKRNLDGLKHQLEIRKNED